MFGPRLVLLGLALLIQHASGRRMAGVELGPQPGAAADAAAPRAPTTTLPASALEGLGGEGGANIERVEMKIINGAVASAGEFDFMVALFANSKFFCGGVLLDNATVLTAAHCLVDTAIISNPGLLRVWVLGTQYPVERVFAHPGYSASKIPEDNQDLTFDGSLHDLGAVRLAAPLPSPATVALAPRDAGVQEGQLLQVAGWGMTESGSPSNVLKFAEVQYMPAYRCPSDYEDVLCGGNTGQNTCNGDSGGPLLIRDAATRKAQVLGVTSHGPDCLAGPNLAHGYYTDVRLYEDAVEAWKQGKEYEWTPQPSNGSSSGGGGASTTTGGGGTATGGAAGEPATPPPVQWQPVPGWEDQWGSGWSAPSGGSSWQDLFCQVFGC